MGDRPARSGDETPDSPLVFSVPASLQEYMSRYVDRPGQHAPPPPPAAAVSPEPFPVRHWFDNRRPNNNSNATTTQPAASSTPLRAAAAAFEYNATNTAAPPAASPTRHDANATTVETGRPTHSDYIAAWRAMSGPPLLGPVDSELEREGQQPPPRRRFHAAAHGVGDHGTESDGGGSGGGRRRVQARSASRGGRPQSSTDARRSGGGLGRGGTGGGSGSGGWSGESGGRVADVPFSPMSAGGRDHGNGGGGGGSVLSDSPRYWHNAYSGNPAYASAWRNRGSPPGQQRSANEMVDERPRVVEGNNMSRGGSAQRGRRSLSDFLREIEEMVRAQREQQNRDAETLQARPQASSQPHAGLRSRPLAAAAAAMGAPPPQEHPMSGGDGNHPYFGGNARYLPPGERRWPTMTSHISRAVTDSRFLPNAAAVTAETGPYHHHHPAVGGQQQTAGAPSSRNTAAQTGGAGAPPTRSHPSYYVIPTLATTAAAAAGAMTGGAGVRPRVAGAAAGPEPREGRPPTAARAALHPPMRLSAAATAFSMPPAGGSVSPDQPHEPSTGSGDANTAEPGPAQRSLVREQFREVESRGGLAIGRDGLAIGREGRASGGVFAAAMAAARARADQSVVPAAVSNPPERGSWASTQSERLAQAGLGFAHGGHLQHGDRGPYLEVVPLTRMAELPPERGAATPADGERASGAGGSDSDGTGGREAEYQSEFQGQVQGQGQNQNQNHLAALPAFRHWESQRARLRIQWHSPNASPEPVGTDSPASDGTMVLTEHLSSNGPSPRGGPGFGRGRGGGGGDDEATKVEEALFACLMRLGVRRLLLLERGGGGAARTRHRRTPAWLEEWLDGGARPHRVECSNAGHSSYENRCPRVGDVWELLELLLGWWAERVCAVAAGFPMWSGQAAAAAAAAAAGAAAGSGPGSSGVGETGQQQRGGEGGRQGGNGMGSLAGDAAATTQAVEAVQGLRKLGEFIMPLSRVREFIGIGGGPTPRDAVLLKSLLVVHEGIAWAADRPHYRHYREEVIPTALKLYASLPQDVLEGVDLEVGHTLPESVFVMTGTARPSWPRWGGSPSSAVTAATPSIEGQREHAPDGHGAGHGGGGGMGFGGGRFIPGRAFSGSGGGGVRMGGGGMRCAGGWEGGGGSGGGGGRGVFLPGPWVVFRVAREEYQEFYRGQAAALDQAIGGSTVELEHLLM